MAEAFWKTIAQHVDSFLRRGKPRASEEGKALEIHEDDVFINVRGHLAYCQIQTPAKKVHLPVHLVGILHSAVEDNYWATPSVEAGIVNLAHLGLIGEGCPPLWFRLSVV